MFEMFNPQSFQTSFTTYSIKDLSVKVLILNCDSQKTIFP